MDYYLTKNKSQHFSFSLEHILVGNGSNDMAFLGTVIDKKLSGKSLHI